MEIPGLKLSELLTIIALILGPGLAVVLSLRFESRRKKYDSRLQVLRMILNTRYNVADPNYNVAINLIPIEFNDIPAVTGAWRTYMDIVNTNAAVENASRHQSNTAAAQTTLIFQLTQCLGFNLSEMDIQTKPYMSQASVDRDIIYLNSLKATDRIASAMEAQLEILKSASATRNT